MKTAITVLFGLSLLAFAPVAPAADVAPEQMTPRQGMSPMLPINPRGCQMKCRQRYRTCLRSVKTDVGRRNCGDARRRCLKHC